MADKAALQAERDLQADISQAVRETEEEIFADALGTDEPDRDDTSLEGMAEDRLEGDETIEDDVDEEPPEVEPAEEPEVPVAETVDPRDTQIAELRAQLNALSQRLMPPQQQPQFQPQPQQPQPQWQQQPPGSPYDNPHDSVLEPDKYHQANVGIMQQIVADQMRMAEETRINGLMEATRQGPRGAEFQQAYNHLAGLPPDQRLPVANQLRFAAHPGQALLDWWDQTPQAQQFAAAEEARMTEFLQQRGYQVRPSGGGRSAQQQAARQPARIPPSLNAIPGGRSHRSGDADNRLTMGDQVDGLPLGDDSAIFANVWRTS